MLTPPDGSGRPRLPPKTKQPFESLDSKGCPVFGIPCARRTSPGIHSFHPLVESPQHGDDGCKAGLLTSPPVPAAFPSVTDGQWRARPKKVSEKIETGLQRRDRSRLSRDSLLRPVRGTLSVRLFQTAAAAVKRFHAFAETENTPAGMRTSGGGVIGGQRFAGCPTSPPSRRAGRDDACERMRRTSKGIFPERGPVRSTGWMCPGHYFVATSKSMRHGYRVSYGGDAYRR